MNYIDEFLSNYRREFDFFEQVSRIGAQQIDLRLQSSGIRAIVTWRAKNISRLADKIKQRDDKKRAENSLGYQSVKEIYEDIVDLAGIRIALYFPGDRIEVDRLIKEQFEVKVIKNFTGTSEPQTKITKRFTGYWAIHYRVGLKSGNLGESQQRYTEARIEIQVASVLMHSWSEVEHDLVYKPLQGDLSEEELSILDELNGLVLAGEISLERLQKAQERRVGKVGFRNHYELASFLFEVVRTKFPNQSDEPTLGDIDVLYKLLDRLHLASPAQISKFIEDLDSDLERRPVAQQVIDQIVATDPSRYELLRVIQLAAGVKGTYSSNITQAVGDFMMKWIDFEKLVRLLALKNSRIIGNRSIPTGIIVQKMDLFNNEDLAKFNDLRRLRNIVVHGVEMPTSDYLESSTKELETLIEKIGKSKQRDVREAWKSVFGKSKKPKY